MLMTALSETSDTTT